MSTLFQRPAGPPFERGQAVQALTSPYRQLPPGAWGTVIDVGREIIEVDWPVLGTSRGPKALPMQPNEITRRTL